ncbi:RDD family protein [Ilumatobacter sp.]|uniref:RDD family protein n=1 Tax=Ilumatobacter sp. TaxID=1967498 RepID=UPI0037519ECA
MADPSTAPSAGHLVSRYVRASFPQRIGAIMVDGMLFCVLVLVPAWIISWGFGPGGMTGCGLTTANLDGECIASAEALRFTRIVFYALSALWVLWYSRSISQGASVGKRSTEILVIDAKTGKTISFRRAVLRTLLSALSFLFFFVGMLVAITNRERRAAHDLIMGTRVISP